MLDDFISTFTHPITLNLTHFNLINIDKINNNNNDYSLTDYIDNVMRFTGLSWSYAVHWSRITEIVAVDKECSFP